MKERPAFNDTGSAEEFKKIMLEHPDFQERELYKVDRAYVKFLEDKILRADM